MSDTRILKPVDGARVRHPSGRLLPATGERVIIDSFWQRRIAAGDVVEVSEAAKPAAPKTARNGRDNTSRE